MSTGDPTTVHRSGTARRLLAAAAAGASALAALAAAVPPAASAADTAAAPLHPDLDWMGSTIPDHEGGSTSTSPSPLSGIEGVDVASHQGNVAWQTLRKSGVRWAYTKATEGNDYTNPYFTQQYDGSYQAGMIRGAYHFATPDDSSGKTQANYFVNHGGGWSKDGKTLPGVLDIEYNPYGATCYGLSKSAMVSWIKDFVKTYRSRTGRDAVIYTTTNWWTQCTGNSTVFHTTDPLWLARFSSSPGALPGGWDFYTFWQYTSTGATVGDHDTFNGSTARLKALANG